MSDAPKQPRNAEVVSKDGQFNQAHARWWDATAKRAYDYAETFRNIVNLTAITSADAGNDYLVVYDATDGKAKRITPANVSSWALFSTIATTSGGTINVTSIAPTVRQIRVTLTGVSLTAADSVSLYLGDSGGVETSSYTPSVPGFTVANDTNNIYGFFDIVSEDGLTWHGIYSIYNSSGSTFSYTFQKTLSAALDRIQLDVNGAATFDAGTMHTWVK